MNSYSAALLGLGSPYDTVKAAKDAALIAKAKKIASMKEQPVLVNFDPGVPAEIVEIPSQDTGWFPKITKMMDVSDFGKYAKDNKTTGGSGILDSFLTNVFAPAATVGAAYGVSKLTKDKRAKFQPQYSQTDWTPIILAGVGVAAVLGIIVIMSSRRGA